MKEKLGMVKPNQMYIDEITNYQYLIQIMEKNQL